MFSCLFKRFDASVNHSSMCDDQKLVLQQLLNPSNRRPVSAAWPGRKSFDSLLVELEKHDNSDLHQIRFALRQRYYTGDRTLEGVCRALDFALWRYPTVTREQWIALHPFLIDAMWKEMDSD